MEELRNEEMINEELGCEELMIPEEETENSIGGLLALGVSALVGLGMAGYAAYKNRDKIKAKRIEKKIAKLEKLGFTVIRNDQAEEESSEELPEETEKEN